MSHKSYKPHHYFPYIDGLRGISVLIILLFHLDVTYFSGGFVGVDVFFVISGFLITNLIVKDLKSGQFSFLDFYARRIRRIFPALFVMLFCSSLLAVVFLGPDQFAGYFKSLRVASGQISNFFFSQDVDYFADGFAHAPLLHTWSLGVEEQFYLVWPLLLLAVHRFLGLQRGYLALIGLLVLSLIFSEYLVRTDAMKAFYMLHSRAWELSMGGIVALGVIPKLTKQVLIDFVSVVGLVLIVASALFLTKGHFPGVKAIAPCLGSALLIYSAQQGAGYAHKFLSIKALVFCGLISYSLYLWHWPLIAFYKSYFEASLSLSVQVVLALLSFVLAFLSYRYVEQPFRLMKVSPVKTIAVGLFVIVCFVLGSNILKKESKADWRVTYKLDEAVVLPHALDKVCSVEGGAFDREKCIVGPNKDHYEVILVGDSFASHYTPMILAWAQEKGLTVRLFMRGACQTWVMTDTVRTKAGKVDNYCMELTPAFYETLEQDQHIQYVFLGLREPSATDDIRRSLEKIVSYKKNTYFLGAGPLFDEHPHDCQVKNNLLITKVFPLKDKRDNCLSIDIDYTNRKLAKTRASFIPLLQEMKVPYFDPLPFMDTPYNIDGQFMFLDEGHMNRYGAMHLVPYFSRFIENTP